MISCALRTGLHIWLLPCVVGVQPPYTRCDVYAQTVSFTLSFLRVLITLR